MIQEKKETHHHRIVPILLIVAGLPIGLVLAFILVANLAVQDEGQPDDSELQLSAVRVPKADNAFEVLRPLLQTPDISVDFDSEENRILESLSDGGAWDEVQVNELLVRYQTNIELLHTASTRPNYQDPYYDDPGKLDWKIPYPYYFPTIREVARAATVEARQIAKDGKLEEGIQKTINIVRLGHLMEQGNVSLIGYLVGSAIKQIGLTGLRVISRENSITPEIALRVSDQLEPFRDTRTGQVTAMKMEYLGVRGVPAENRTVSDLIENYQLTVDENGQSVRRRNVWANIFDGVGLGRYYFMPNQTWRMSIELTKQRLAAIDVDCHQYRSSAYAFQALRQSGPLRFFEPNAIGKFLMEIGQISFSGFIEKRCNESIAVSATQISLAISAYLQDQGQLPSSLTELIPDYLTSLPVDPYTIRPFHYLPEKKVIYSVGPERNDLGGDEPSRDWQRQPNPTLQVAD